MPECLETPEGKPDRLDEFLSYLAADGGWRSLEEAAEAIRVTRSEVLMVARFFSRFGFVEFDGEAGKVRIDRKIRAWYAEET